MSLMQSLILSLTSNKNVSVLGVIIFLAVVSSNSIIPSIISLSDWLIAPFSSPISIKLLISSLEICSSIPSVFTLHIFKITLVENDKNHTKGLVTLEINIIGFIADIANFSDFWSAILFGTSSPKTNVI